MLGSGPETDDGLIDLTTTDKSQRTTPGAVYCQDMHGVHNSVFLHTRRTVVARNYAPTTRAIGVTFPHTRGTQQLLSLYGKKPL